MPIYGGGISAVTLRTLTDDFQPQDYGLIAWNFDPATCSRSNSVPAGTVQGSLIWIPARTITNLNFQVATAGAALTAAENFAALYTAAGTLLSATADLSTVFTSTGSKIEPLATPQNVAAGWYYVAFLSNGTTPPALECGTGSGIANFTGIVNPRFGNGPTAQTVMPATAAFAATPGPSYWVGVS